MLIEFIIALLVGVIAGTCTGLFPGIHINLVSAGLLALVAGGFFAGIEPLVLVVFVVAMAITHTFIDFIPSVFLGAPDEDSFLTVLPGHRLLMEGKGYEAVVMTLYGSLVALPIILIFSFIFVKFLPVIYNFSRVLIPYILIFVSLYFVFTEENKTNAAVVFVMAGFLGLFTFNLPVKEPLLPLLTGLFGTSALIISLKTKLVVPKQEILKLKEIKLKKKLLLKSSLAAAVAAPFCSFLPGIGAGHAAIIGSGLLGDSVNNKRSFLFLIGAINTIVMALSFVTVYAIDRTRTGAAVAVDKILGAMNVNSLIVIMVAIFLSGILAFLVGVNISKFFSKKISKINYRVLSLVVLCLLVFVNLVLSNLTGFLILITASAVGIFCITSRVRRIQLMAALIVQTIIFYLV